MYWPYEDLAPEAEQRSYLNGKNGSRGPLATSRRRFHRWRDPTSKRYCRWSRTISVVHAAYYTDYECIERSAQTTPRKFRHTKAHGGQRRPQETGARLPPLTPENRRMGRRLPRQAHCSVKSFARFPCICATASSDFGDGLLNSQPQRRTLRLRPSPLRTRVAASHGREAIEKRSAKPSPQRSISGATLARPSSRSPRCAPALDQRQSCARATSRARTGFNAT